MKGILIKLILGGIIGLGSVWYHMTTVHGLETELADTKLELSEADNELLRCNNKIDQINADVEFDEERGKIYDESMKELLDILKKVRELKELSYETIRDSYTGTTCDDAMKFLQEKSESFKW